MNELRTFVREREWERFHTSKNLAMAIASEAGELLGEYRWIEDGEADAWSRDPENHARVANEAADVGIALLLFCDRIGVDLLDAIPRKIAINRANYPLAASKGRPERPRRGHDG
ncbi:MAG: nucleotide pyrophosphohydrolase [Gemmatimonadetes bacterium]|nr:nucleotide pyrophosphohydrolase [Gemmatimonadota bacterium]